MKPALPHRAPHLVSNERQPLPLVPPPTTKQPAAYAATVVGPGHLVGGSLLFLPYLCLRPPPLMLLRRQRGRGRRRRRRRQWVILLSAAAQGTIVPYRLGWSLVLVDGISVKRDMYGGMLSPAEGEGEISSS
ncbi:hypothetical protein B296_00019238 [Ensete ventricosum]|uniref:Uncharacterized protein n=1 Tax=Ensete ventricosum TaxID=4639 RepID=A0A426YJ37_ENSVE|nr:hypothetical protein B296_00019238 [Ensete ventricosum]